MTAFKLTEGKIRSVYIKLSHIQGFDRLGTARQTAKSSSINVGMLPNGISWSSIRTGTGTYLGDRKPHGGDGGRCLIIFDAL